MCCRQLYATAAIVGAAVYVLLVGWGTAPDAAALAGIGGNGGSAPGGYSVEVGAAGGPAARGGDQVMRVCEMNQGRRRRTEQRLRKG